MHRLCETKRPLRPLRPLGVLQGRAPLDPMAHGAGAGRNQRLRDAYNRLLGGPDGGRAPDLYLAAPLRPMGAEGDEGREWQRASPRISRRCGSTDGVTFSGSGVAFRRSSCS